MSAFKLVNRTPHSRATEIRLPLRQEAHGGINWLSLPVHCEPLQPEQAAGFLVDFAPVPVDHYENFPVASVLLPRRLRPAVEAIYRFARTADDLADEGDAPPAERLAALNAYRAELAKLEAGTPSAHPVFVQLAPVITAYRLPYQPFYDLLSAFSQDVIKTRYDNFAQLLNYCARSANPVGQLMLHLYGANEPWKLQASDAICSALQLINFWQDIAVDWKKGRVYLPQDDLLRFGVTESMIAQAHHHTPAWQALMRFETERASAMLESGAPLALALPGRVGWELRLVIQGGLRIAEQLQAARFDVFEHRPVLRPFDWVQLIWRSLFMKSRTLASAS